MKRKVILLTLLTALMAAGFSTDTFAKRRTKAEKQTAKAARIAKRAKRAKHKAAKAKGKRKERLERLAKKRRRKFQKLQAESGMVPPEVLAKRTERARIVAEKVSAIKSAMEGVRKAYGEKPSIIDGKIALLESFITDATMDNRIHEPFFRYFRKLANNRATKTQCESLQKISQATLAKMEEMSILKEAKQPADKLAQIKQRERLRENLMRSFYKKDFAKPLPIGNIFGKINRHLNASTSTAASVKEFFGRRKGRKAGTEWLNRHFTRQVYFMNPLEHFVESLSPELIGDTKEQVPLEDVKKFFTKLDETLKNNPAWKTKFSAVIVWEGEEMTEFEILETLVEDGLAKIKELEAPVEVKVRIAPPPAEEKVRADEPILGDLPEA